MRGVEGGGRLVFLLPAFMQVYWTTKWNYTWWCMLTNSSASSKLAGRLATLLTNTPLPIRAPRHQPDPKEQKENARAAFAFRQDGRWRAPLVVGEWVGCRLFLRVIWLLALSPHRAFCHYLCRSRCCHATSCESITCILKKTWFFLRNGAICDNIWYNTENDLHKRSLLITHSGVGCSNINRELYNVASALLNLYLLTCVFVLLCFTLWDY